MLKIIFDNAKRKYGGKAKEYLKDKDKAKDLVNRVKEKGKDESQDSEAISGVWGKIKLFISLMRDWISREYNTIPYRSIFAIAVAMIYFVSPIDFVPDFILGLGLVDDAAIILQVFRQINKDLEKYQAWKAPKTLDIDAEEE